MILNGRGPSSVAESVRKLRTSLTLEVRHAKGSSRVVAYLVTSCLGTGSGSSGMLEYDPLLACAVYYSNP